MLTPLVFQRTLRQQLDLYLIADLSIQHISSVFRQGVLSA